MANWIHTEEMDGDGYTCGFCGNRVSPSCGYKYHDSTRYINICPKCEHPTYFSVGKQTPAPLPGDEVNGVPEEINSIYKEARACTSVGAFSSAVLACRKLLMHIAVDKGAPEEKRFIAYVEYLSDRNYITPDGMGWVDYIREMSREADYEMAKMGQKDALALLSFIEVLLTLIYEFPSRLPPPKPRESQKG
jgi:hypothetical protein